MNEFVFEPYEPKPETYPMYIFRQNITFTKYRGWWNGKLQFNGKEHLLSWSVNPTQMHIDGVQVSAGSDDHPHWPIADRFMLHLARLHKLTAWQQYDNGFEDFETYTSEHLIYSAVGLDFYAETSIDDTCWRYVTNGDDRCWHSSRWFNGMDYKPCLYHFRHWVNSTIEYKEDSDTNI